MQVISPIEITDSNMTSSIPEPDVSLGEAEWVDGRLNYKTTSLATFGITGINGNLYVVEANGSGGRDVVVYDSDLTITDSWTASESSVKAIMNDGTYLYLLGNSTASTTTVTIYKYQTDGTPVTSFAVTPSQAFDQCDRAMCYLNGHLYVHSKLGATHSTVSVYNATSGTLVDEYDVSGLGYLIDGLETDGDNFYLNLFASGNTLYSSDSEFSSFNKMFATWIAETSTIGVFYDGAVFWFCLLGLPYGFGFLSNNGLGLGVYLIGEQAIKTSTHRIYQATANTTDDPEDGVNLIPPTWVDVSATNKYRAFDYVKNLQSVWASPFIITLTPNSLYSSLAVFNISGATGVNIKMDDPTAGEVYNVDIDLNDISGIVNMWQYFFYQPALIDKFVIDDLPPYKDATLTLTFTGPADIGIGELVYGRGRFIGEMVAGTSTDRKSFSTIEIDDFGNEKRTTRPSATYTSYQVSLSTRTAEYVERVLKDVLDVPTLFIGNDVDGVKLPDLGYYERSALVRGNPGRSEINIKVRGLV